MIKRIISSALVTAIAAGYCIFNNTPPSIVNDPRYQKISALGENMPIWSGPWHCVFDKKTNLLWEVKSNNETIHDSYWSYSWFSDQRGVENMGDCYFEEDRCDSFDLIRAVNKEKLCGVTNWRLPTQSELQSLLFDNDRPGEAKIRKDFFPYTKAAEYWTNKGQQPLSGIYQYLEEGAIAIDFTDGSAAILPYQNAPFLRLVHDKN